MAEVDRARMRAQAACDQGWANLRKWEADIERIATEGSNGSKQDEQLVRGVFCVVMGELHRRAGELLHVESDQESPDDH